MFIIPEESAYYKYSDYLTDNYISENSVFSPTIYGPILVQVYLEQQIIGTLSTNILMNNFINHIHI